MSPGPPGYTAPQRPESDRITVLEKRNLVETLKVVSSAGLTAATAATTVFIAPKRTRYRATGILFDTTGGDAITVTLNIVHTDRVGAVTGVLINAFSVLATGRTHGTYTFEANVGTTVQWSTTLSGARVLSVWAVEIRFEEVE